MPEDEHKNSLNRLSNQLSHILTFILRGFMPFDIRQIDTEKGIAEALAAVDVCEIKATRKGKMAVYFIGGDDSGAPIYASRNVVVRQPHLRGVPKVAGWKLFDYTSLQKPEVQ